MPAAEPKAGPGRRTAMVGWRPGGWSLARRSPATCSAARRAEGAPVEHVVRPQGQERHLNGRDPPVGQCPASAPGSSATSSRPTTMATPRPPADRQFRREHPRDPPSVKGPCIGGSYVSVHVLGMGPPCGPAPVRGSTPDHPRVIGPRCAEPGVPDGGLGGRRLRRSPPAPIDQLCWSVGNKQRSPP